MSRMTQPSGPFAATQRTSCGHVASHRLFTQVRDAFVALHKAEQTNQKQRPAHEDALRGLAGTVASPQIMCIRAKADIVEKPKPEPPH